jgi:ketosteroid isomerase-like protein
MTSERERAREPAEGLALLYESDAVLAFPPGEQTVGREAIRHLMERLLSNVSEFAVEVALPTMRFEDLALTSTRPADNTGGRVQVSRRQPDGTWLRILDRPEIPS